MNPFISGALAAHEQHAKLQQLLSLIQGRDLQGASARANVLAQTEGGGAVDFPGLGQTKIPGINRRTELENAAAKARAKATTAGGLEAQIEVQDKLSQKAITDAKERLKAAGISEDSEDYNRQIAKLLGIQDEIEIDVGGRKIKLPAKDAASIIERQESSKAAMARAEKVANISANARIQAAKIAAKTAADRATKMPASVQKDIANINTAESVFLRIAEQFKNPANQKLVGGVFAGGGELKGKAKSAMGRLNEEQEAFRIRVADEMNKVVNDLGGANVPPAEFERLRQGLPNLGMSPAAFRAAVNVTVGRIRRLRDNLLKNAETGQPIPEENLFDDDDAISVDWDGTIPPVG